MAYHGVGDKVVKNAQLPPNLTLHCYLSSHPTGATPIQDTLDGFVTYTHADDEVYSFVRASNYTSIFVSLWLIFLVNMEPFILIHLQLRKCACYFI